jgi:hypothetical protein
LRQAVYKQAAKINGTGLAINDLISADVVYSALIIVVFRYLSLLGYVNCIYLSFNYYFICVTIGYD